MLGKCGSIMEKWLHIGKVVSYRKSGVIQFWVSYGVVAHGWCRPARCGLQELGDERLGSQSVHIHGIMILMYASSKKQVELMVIQPVLKVVEVQNGSRSSSR